MLQATLASAALDVLVFGDAAIHTVSYLLAMGRYARVQCAFWGSPLTTGLASIDYFLVGEDFGCSAAAVDSEAFTEQVVRLHGLAAYLYPLQRPNAPPPTPFAGANPAVDGVRDVAARTALLTRHGVVVGAHAPVLFCPQALVKVHPEFDAAVDRLLAAFPDAVVVLLQGDGPVWASTLRRRQAASMVHADRVVVLPRLTAQDFGTLLSTADVVLDTMPYSSFTVTLEALTMGSLVVTRAGNTVRG